MREQSKWRNPSKKPLLTWIQLMMNLCPRKIFCRTPLLELKALAQASPLPVNTDTQPHSTARCQQPHEDSSYKLKNVPKNQLPGGQDIFWFSPQTNQLIFILLTPACLFWVVFFETLNWFKPEVPTHTRISLYTCFKYLFLLFSSTAISLPKHGSIILSRQFISSLVLRISLNLSFVLPELFTAFHSVLQCFHHLCCCKRGRAGVTKLSMTRNFGNSSGFLRVPYMFKEQFLNTSGSSHHIPRLLHPEAVRQGYYLDFLLSNMPKKEPIFVLWRLHSLLINTFLQLTQTPHVYPEINISELQKAIYSLLPAFHVFVKATSMERILQNWSAWSQQIPYLFGEVRNWISKEGWKNYHGCKFRTTITDEGTDHVLPRAF